LYPLFHTHLFTNSYEYLTFFDLKLYIAFLNACGEALDLQTSTQIFQYAETKKAVTPSIVAALIYTVARCGNLEDAKTIFDNIILKQENKQGKAVLWRSMTSAYPKNANTTKNTTATITTQQHIKTLLLTIL
jgi:uncharacterized protein HemY